MQSPQNKKQLTKKIFSDVLHVRTTLHRVRDTSDHVLGDDYPALLLPPLRWRLPLVVEGLPQLRLHRRIPLHLLLPLLRHQTQHHRRRLHFPILWLYLHYGVPILPSNGYNRLYGLLLVRKEDLQCGESWLDKSAKWPLWCALGNTIWFLRPGVCKFNCVTANKTIDTLLFLLSTFIYVGIFDCMPTYEWFSNICMVIFTSMAYRRNF